jgi:hypothetical protein
VPDFAGQVGSYPTSKVVTAPQTRLHNAMIIFSGAALATFWAKVIHGVLDALIDRILLVV